MMKTLVRPTNAPPEVGATLQRLRLARGLTLEDLSRIAGVSKSMLSQIEREKANPTIAITWRLANALGVQIGELLSSETRARRDDPRARRARDPTLPGNHAGYVLRILGPMELAGKYEWYELTLAPGRRTGLAGARSGHQRTPDGAAGALEGGSGGSTRSKVKPAARRAIRPTRAHVMRNTGKTEAKALLVVVHR
jgi:transcriptional regulator with XRE-family HTH domain